MNHKFFFLFFLVSLSCSPQKKITNQNIISIYGKVLDDKFIELQQVEISSNDYFLKTYTDENGNFKISTKAFIDDFMDGYDILISLKKMGYESKNVVINKRTHLNGTSKLKFFSIEPKAVQEKEITKENKSNKTVIEKIETEKTETNKLENQNNTEINVEKVVNEKDGTINFGNVTYDQSSTVNEGDNTTIYNETKIIKETKTIEIPFEERECGKKNIGYIKMVNTSSNPFEIRLAKIPPGDLGWATGYSNYKINTKAVKYLILESNHTYSFGGTDLTKAKYSGFYSDFKDNVFLNPCDTQVVNIF
ncbi:MAG: hypothetical protein ACPGVH_03920 [Chitinophagales bacterium]